MSQKPEPTELEETPTTGPSMDTAQPSTMETEESTTANAATNAENSQTRRTSNDNCLDGSADAEKLAKYIEKNIGKTEVLFFIERTPRSPRGSKCKLSSCQGQIKSGTYRAAVVPGKFTKGGDYYHVSCLEKIVDLGVVKYLDRVVPVTRKTVGVRGLNGLQMLDGTYHVTSGVERLVYEWKYMRDRWLDELNGEPQDPPDPAFEALMKRAGSASYEPPKEIEGMNALAIERYARDLAPIESDGKDDTDEWNLFEEYLSTDQSSLQNRHDLSKTLRLWTLAVLLVRAKDENLTQMLLDLKNNMSDKEKRAIKRLSSIIIC